MIRSGFALLTMCVMATAGHADAPPTKNLLPGFRRSPWFGEQIKEQWIEGDVRVLVNVPGDFDPNRPTRLIVYATPNGNTIEWTLLRGA